MLSQSISANYANKTKARSFNLNRPYNILQYLKQTISSSLDCQKISGNILAINKSILLAEFIRLNTVSYGFKLGDGYRRLFKAKQPPSINTAVYLC